MRLINITTLQFEEFDQPPPYVILSHRWTQDEITFELFRTGGGRESQGFKKIQKLCHAVKRYNIWRKQNGGSQSDDIRFVWNDTCCIDKRSSAELSEAINSMYTWYQQAEFCCTYLADVEVPASCTEDDIFELIRPSEWWSRGWTLQELLAPRMILFCDKNWRFIAHKCNHDHGKYSCEFILPTLHANRLIADSCRIGLQYLDSPTSIYRASIAQRLSWAAERTTTRVEDMAYCLLGILRINMPLLYGEGRRAFRRLQEAIISQTADESIFAWVSREWTGVLAKDPSSFQGMSSIEYARDVPFRRTEYVVTHRGLRIRAKAIKLQPEDGRERWLVPLRCRDTAIVPHIKGTDADSQSYVSERYYGDRLEELRIKLSRITVKMQTARKMGDVETANDLAQYAIPDLEHSIEAQEKSLSERLREQKQKLTQLNTKLAEAEKIKDTASIYDLKTYAIPDAQARIDQLERHSGPLRALVLKSEDGETYGRTAVIDLFVNVESQYAKEEKLFYIQLDDPNEV